MKVARESGRTNMRPTKEGVSLVPKYIVLNPKDLKIFDALIKPKSRSEAIRELIREHNQRHDSKNETR